MARHTNHNVAQGCPLITMNHKINFTEADNERLTDVHPIRKLRIQNQGRPRQTTFDRLAVQSPVPGG